MDRTRRSRTRSKSPRAISPIRSTNPLGRPFGGGWGRGRGRGGAGRWQRGGARFVRRDRSVSKSPKRHRSRSRDRDRKRPYDDAKSRSNTQNSIDLTGKDAAGQDTKQSEALQKTTQQLKAPPVSQSAPANDDPPPPGTEDEVESVEKMLAHANKIRKEVMIKRNPDFAKNPQ